jgi:integrase
VLRHAAKAKLIKVDDVPYMELPPPVAPKDLWMNEQQEAEFYALALGFSYRNPQTKGRLSKVTRFVCIALDTAQRKTAIFKLKWSSVDFAAGLIDFRLPGATSKKQSVVPISIRLRPMLERAYRERVSEYVLDSQADISSRYDEFAAGRGYGWVTPHTLRHTAATLMLRAGVPVWDVAGVLGNSPSMVERVYGHHAPEHLRAAVDKRFS